MKFKRSTPKKLIQRIAWDVFIGLITSGLMSLITRFIKWLLNG